MNGKRPLAERNKITDGRERPAPGRLHAPKEGAAWRGTRAETGQRVLLRAAVFALIGVACLLLVHITGRGIPCPIRLVTGLRCPGCGITRMILALSRLDLKAAFRANAFLTVTLPYLILLLLYSAYKWIRNEKTGTKAEAAEVLYCAGLILFGILRNIR